VNTSEILTRAADLIDKRGHAKRAYQTSDGALCLRGAVIKAVSLRFSFKRCSLTPAAAQVAIAAFRRHIGCYGEITWNDAPERTKEEVVTALRGAAEAARAEQ
jgi:hypothetical protein